jgi:hypothetical protein
MPKVIDRIDHDAEATELLVTYVNDGPEYETHVKLAAGPSAVAWAIQADRLARRYARTYGPDDGFSAETVLLFAIKLAAYYAAHLREI